jgi:hypothetical protein
MNPIPDIGTDAGGSFDPQEAAALLDQSSQQARRGLEPYPPWLVAIRGVLALGVLGAVWLTVRGQHPYQGPTAAVIPFVIAFAVINLAVTVGVARRATAGVSGRSRLHPAEIAIAAAAWVVVFAVMGVLAAQGVSRGIVYGVYPMTAPLIVAGLAWAAIMARRASWRQSGTAVAVAAVGIVGLFAGPAGAWAVAGVGLCLVLLGSAAVIVWRQRRGVVGS